MDLPDYYKCSLRSDFVVAEIFVLENHIQVYFIVLILFFEEGCSVIAFTEYSGSGFMQHFWKFRQSS